ncbi:mitochondrial membrane protein [Candida orthopsilosis Co 90-125]|uniref:Mitochondrial membrane protein n=1 Tax=Candida orthopsilosis (strain 90-125) TaxID=1136231 RepID=H8X734_CANO9|nr:mitochondrial membrane protein [Candida orthopsilosis Co 90-125]CCG23962.1 mitochondrial membrane protein [Candida orthopsilosis Co 90-125]
MFTTLTGPSMLSRRLLLSRSVLKPTTPLSLRCYSSDPFPIKQTQSKKVGEPTSKFGKLVKYVQSQYFQDKTMPRIYLSAIIVSFIPLYFYMRDRYYEDKQLKVIREKYANDPKSLSEYEYLALKSLSQSDKLRPLEQKKYKIYQLMRKEFRRKNFLSGEMFNPTPEELDEWYSKQARFSSKKKKAPVLQDVSEEYKVNFDNSSIAAPEDTTDFYDSKAKEYDDAVKWEERGIFMGIRRRWLMSHVKGDVLEVSCGTGRNIPYLSSYIDKIRSVTFLDSSKNMVEVTKEKFEKAFPNFKKVAFTQGKAEDLLKMAPDDNSLKYDTVVEAFGLCCHEDPVQVLRNMAKLLKPGGRIILLEHGRSKWDFINNHLDFRSEKRMKKWKCRWNLDIGELVDEANLDITLEKRAHLSTTWMLVLKRPEDPITLDEKPFLDKLFGRETKSFRK